MRGFLLVAWYACLAASEHIVLKPVTEDKTLPEKMLLLMHGGAVENSYYVKTGAAVQQALSKDVRLWVTLPKTFNNLCILSCATSSCRGLRKAVDGALNMAEDQGWNRGQDSENLWIAGHSLGGICAGRLLKSLNTGDSPPYAGAIMWASFVGDGSDYSYEEYPIPFMIMMGEMDGLSTNPAGTAPYWRKHLEAAAEDEDKSVREKLTVVLPGVNHSNWCPGFDGLKETDLMADVSETVALERIGEATAAFIRANTAALSETQQQAGMTELKDLKTWTHSLMDGYMAALDLEKGGFCAEAQKDIAGVTGKTGDFIVSEGRSFDDISGMESCTPEMTDGEPSVVKTCGALLEEGRALGCRVIPRERINQKLDRPADGAGSCADGIAAAERVALSLAPEWTKARYLERGRKWVGEKPDNEPWPSSRWNRVDIEEREDTEALFLRSVVRHDGGSFMDCKLASPARALDWMMTDSLRSEPTSSTLQIAHAPVRLALVPENNNIGILFSVLSCCLCCISAGYFVKRRSQGEQESKADSSLALAQMDTAVGA